MAYRDPLRSDLEDTPTLAAIVDELDAQEWTPTTLQNIADTLTHAGWLIREPEQSPILQFGKVNP